MKFLGKEIAAREERTGARSSLVWTLVDSVNTIEGGNLLSIHLFLKGIATPERKKSGNRSDIIQRLIDRSSFVPQLLERNCFLLRFSLFPCSSLAGCWMAERGGEEDVSEGFSSDDAGDPRRWSLQGEGTCDERMVSLGNLVYLNGNDGAIGGCAEIGPIPKAATRSFLASLLTNGAKIWLTVEPASSPVCE